MLRDVFGYTWYDPEPEEYFDRIAVERGGFLRSCGYGEELPRYTERIPNTDWGTIVLGRRGMGNHGCIFLRPLTEAKRKMLLEGLKRAIGEFND